jgi:hypothetical protein
MEWDRKDMLGENKLDFSMTLGLFPFSKGGLNEMS